MDLSYGPEAEAFRRGLREFLEANRERAPRGGQLMTAATKAPELLAWQRLLIEHGYAARTIPKEYGGYGAQADPLIRIIMDEEFARSGVAAGIGGQGPDMLVPTLLEHGSEEQKQRWIRPTILGEVVWCQGYSEPNAGSDLANVQTRAREDGADFLINGQKIWTTTAHQADMMFGLIRTEPEATKHGGLSYVLIPMDTPGIDVRPLGTMTGRAEFNEVFFTDVRVPQANVVGKRGEGWKIANTTLTHERNSLAATGQLESAMARLVELMQGETRDGRRAIDDPALRDRLVRLQARLVGPQLGVALTDRRQLGDDRVGDGRLEIPVPAGAREVRDDRVRGAPRAGSEHIDEVGHARLVLTTADHRRVLGVRHRALDLLLDRLRLVEDVDRPLLAPAGRGHLARRILEVHDPRADGGNAVLGHDEDLLALRREARVEALGDVAHEFQVLALVLPDRHLAGAVGEHVGGLQHRVEEQARGDQLTLGERLVAELMHAVQLAERGDRREQPAQLGVLLHVALAEQDALLRVQARRDQRRERVVDAVAQLGRVVGDGDRVQIDDAVEALVTGRRCALLALDVLADRADVVAEVLAAGGLDPAEDAHAGAQASDPAPHRGSSPLRWSARRSGHRPSPPSTRRPSRCRGRPTPTGTRRWTT